MRNLLGILLCLLACSCAALTSAIPVIVDVIAAINDAEMILDQIDTAADALFETDQLPPEVELKYDNTMAKARSSLNVALRTAHATEKLEQKDVDAAFAEFKAAYAELLTLIGGMGLTTGNTLKATPGTEQVTLPEPLALTLKVK